jgi:hypothetical protein
VERRRLRRAAVTCTSGVVAGLGTYAGVAAGWSAALPQAQGQLVMALAAACLAAGTACVATWSAMATRSSRDEPQLPSDRPRPDPPHPRPAELPMDLADFTGRARVASEFELALRDGPSGSPRIVNLFGMGGAGKTTLAVHVAHRIASAFVDGQLFVDLQAYGGTPRKAFSVLGDFLTSLGLERSAVPPEIGARTGLYRSLTSKAALLVVLDNALSAEQVLPLLPSSPASSVIVTSRNRLGEIPGATLVHSTL